MWKMCIPQNCREIVENRETIKYFIEPGISAYKNIMYLYANRNHNGNDNALLCHLFYDFYNIRGLQNDRKRAVFTFFLEHPGLHVDELFNRILEITQRHDLSLTTKLYHTANRQNGIIVDVHVCDFCGRENVARNIQLLERIQDDFNNQCVRDLAGCFDALFPQQGQGISALKKIDFMIWGWGKWKRFEEGYPHQP